MRDRYNDIEWDDYLEKMVDRHGESIRDVLVRQSSADAGDAAQIRGRQRASWRLRFNNRNRSF